MPLQKTDLTLLKTKLSDILGERSYYRQLELPNMQVVSPMEMGVDSVKTLGINFLAGKFEDCLYKSAEGVMQPMKGTIDFEVRENEAFHFIFNQDVQLYGNSDFANWPKWNELTEKIKGARKFFQTGFQKHVVVGHLTDPQVSKNTAVVDKYFHQMTDAEFLEALESMGQAYENNATTGALPDTLILPLSERTGLAKPLGGERTYGKRLDALQGFLGVSRIIFDPWADKKNNGSLGKSFYKLYAADSVVLHYGSLAPRFGELFVTEPDVMNSRMSAVYGFLAQWTLPASLPKQENESIIFEHAV